MKKFLFIIGLCLSFNIDAQSAQATDEAIKKKMIQASISNYSGNCPCPYNTASNGSRCGKRSAYNRAGGYAPICYPEDVSAQMIRDYKSRT